MATSPGLCSRGLARLLARAFFALKNSGTRSGEDCGNLCRYSSLGVSSTPLPPFRWLENRQLLCLETGVCPEALLPLQWLLAAPATRGYPCWYSSCVKMGSQIQTLSSPLLVTREASVTKVRDTHILCFLSLREKRLPACPKSLTGPDPHLGIRPYST